MNLLEYNYGKMFTNRGDVMKYLILVGVVLGAWIVNLFIAMAFRIYTKGNAQEYEQKLKDNGNNIIIYGLLSVGGLFLGNMFGGWITYAILIIGAIIVLIGALPLLIMLVTTIPLTFSKNHRGIADTGKFSDWIFFVSSLTENMLMLFMVYIMYFDFF